MTRLQGIATSSDLRFAQVSRLTLAFLCALFFGCGPPPSRMERVTPYRPRLERVTPYRPRLERGTEYQPTATAPMSSHATSMPTFDKPDTFAPTVTPSPSAPTSPADPAQNAGRSTAGELHVALRENINTLNPYLAANASESFVIGLLYDTLADDDTEGGLMPNLAERWELSANGTKLTCWLNSQARWHNGQPVTAEDVVFTFNLIRQTAFPGLARVAALVAQAEALGPAEVQFTLLRPSSEAVRQVCSQVPIVPAVLWKSVQDPLTYANLDNPIGSGPFALLERAATEEGRLVLRNTGMHHSTKPSIDRITVEVIRDESKALQTLQEGGFDVLGWDITRTMARDVRDHPESYVDIQLATAAGVTVHSLLFNLRLAPYDSLALRSALAQAIDTQAIVDQVLLGFADRGTAGLFPPSSPWYDGGLTVVPFDAQQAMETLTLAGFVDRDGDGLRENPDGSALEVSITCAKADPSSRVVELVVACWRAVGIKAKVSAVPAEEVRSLLMQAKFEVILHDLSLRELAEAFFYFHSSRGALVTGRVSGYNYGGYASADYDRIAEIMLEEQNPEKQLELLRELQGILSRDLPQIPLYSPYLLHLYSDSRFSGWHPEAGVGLLGRRAIANLSAR